MQKTPRSQRTVFKRESESQKEFKTARGAEKAVIWAKKNVYKPGQLRKNF